MSNSDNSESRAIERIFRQQTAINKAVLDRKWDPEGVADCLQDIICFPPRVLPCESGECVSAVYLGTITAPVDYVHGKCVSMFLDRNRGKLTYNVSITDDNFPNPSRILVPGDKFRVDLLTQTTERQTTSEWRMKLLSERNAVCLGLQGLCLVYDQCWSNVPTNTVCVSFDQSDRLFKNSNGECMVPLLHKGPMNRFSCRNYAALDLGYFCGHIDSTTHHEINPWGRNQTFLCFTEVVEEAREIPVASVDVPDQLMEKVIDYGP